MIWRKRPTSPTNISWHFGSIRTISSRSFSLARAETSVATSSIASARLKGAGSSTSWPASIFEKSRMSLMMVSSALPDFTMMSVNIFCLGVELGLCQQFGHAEHAVHRRAYLVAHIGEEFRLGAVGEHGLALRLLELLLALLQFGDVGRRADQIERAVGRGHRALARDLVAQRTVRRSHRLGDLLGDPGFEHGAIAFHEGFALNVRKSRRRSCRSRRRR